MKKLLLTLAILSPFCIGSASAAVLAGQCPTPKAYSNCIEWKVGGNWYHTYTGVIYSDTTDTSAGATPFAFSGRSTLTCVDIDAECTLNLNGYVTADNDGLDVIVTGGSVTDCPAFISVDLSGFPWTTASQIAWPTSGDLAGTLEGVGVTGRLFGLPVCSASNAHIHDVVFNNNGLTPSCFSFGGELHNAAHTGLNIFVNGDVCNDDINAYGPN